MIKLFLVSSDNNNSFGVSAVIKNLSKELNKYCMVNKNFHINNLLNSQKKILHIHGCWSLKVFFYFIIAKLLNIKIILSPHGMADPYSFSLKPIKKKFAWVFFQRFIFQYSDFIIVNSYLEKRNIHKLTKKKKISVIPHGIDDLKRVKSKKNLKKKKLKFVYFSRIHPVKNLLKLVEIWKSDEFFKELKLYIYGDISDEKYFDKIKKIIFKRDNFIYKGPLYKNKIKTLSKYDVLIYPSLSENFGLVVLEALAGGLYLILNKDLPWKTLKTKNLASLIKFEKKNLISSIKIINKNRNTIFSERRKNDIKKMLIKDFRWKKIALKYFEIYNFLLNNSKTF